MNTFNKISEIVKRSITGLMLLVCFGGAYIHSAVLFSLLICIVLLITLFLEWPKLVQNKSIFTTIFISLFYPILPFLSLVWLTVNFYDKDIYLPIYPFLIAWSADTWGYIVGKIAGFHKIYPSISPGKSWEGLLGSFFGVFCINIFILPRINTFSNELINSNFIYMLLFSFILTVIAFTGGFFLSVLKRKQGLKDAGDLLPGHGGLLDRFDSVLFVSPCIVMLCLFYNYTLK